MKRCHDNMRSVLGLLIPKLQHNFSLSNRENDCTIFKTTEQPSDESAAGKITFFNKSLDNIKRDHASGQGIVTSLFSGSHVTNKDIAAISQMDQAMKNGSTTAQAWQLHMTGCTAAAKQQAQQCLKNKGDLSQLTAELGKSTLSAKAGQFALQSLATAGNMFVSWAVTQALQFAVTAIDDYIHRLDNAKEELAETQSELSSIEDEINQNNNSIKELQSMDPSSLSITDKEDLQRLKDQNKELKIRQQYLQEQEQDGLQTVADLTKEKYGEKYSSATEENINRYRELYKNGPKKPKPASSYLTGDSTPSSHPYAPGQNTELSKESDSLANLIAKYEYYSSEKKKAIQNNNAKDLEQYNKELSNLKDKLIENRTELQGFSDDLSASGESSPELDKIHFQLSEIDNLLLSPGENLINFINSDALTQTREELVSLIDAGELTQDQLSRNFSDINSYLTENGLTLEDLISVIKTYREELADPTANKGLLSLTDAKNAVNGYENGDSHIMGLNEEYALLKEILSDTGNVQQGTYEKLLSCSSKYAAAIKTENGLITVNTAKLEQVAKSRQMDTREAILQALALKKQEWVQWSNNIENYNGTLLDTIKSNYDNIDVLQSEITQYELLANSINNTSDAFSRFTDAQSTNDQDMYDTAEQAYQVMKEYSGNENSENYRKYNRDEFQESTMFLMDDATYKKALEAKDIDEYQKVIDEFLNSIAPLFDENNAKSASRLFQEVEKVMASGDAPKADSDWAKQLGISEEMFHALKQMSNQYGFNGNEIFESHHLNTLEEYQSLLSNVKLTQEALDEVSDQTSKEYLKLSNDLNAAKTKYNQFTEETTNSIQEAYASFKDSEESSGQSFADYLKQTLGFDDNDITGSIDVLLGQASTLEEKMMNLPISSEPYQRLKEEFDSIQEYLNSLGYFDQSYTPEYGTSLGRSILNNDIEQYQALQDEANAQMKIMESSETGTVTYDTAAEKLRTIQEQMNALKEPLEIRIQFHIDELDTEIKRLEESLPHASSSQEIYTIHTAIKTAKNEKKELRENLENTKNSAETIDSLPIQKNAVLTYQPDFSKAETAVPPPLSGKVYYTAVLSDTEKNNSSPSLLGKLTQTFFSKGKKKKAKADGTFHAFSQGTPANVSIQTNEKALVNELGEEGLVRNGKLMTIHGGAQFLNLRRGDIIFNHRQMKQLKKYGYTTGRGTLIGAHAKGTVYPAFNSMGNTSTKTNLDFMHTIGSSLTSSSSHTNSSAAKASETAARDSAKKTQEAFSQLFNWLERRVKNLQGVFSKWLKQAETALTARFITKYYKRAASSMRQELDTYRQSYETYNNKANEVGLSPDYAQKVRDGSIDLETVTNEELAGKITSYQEWYEKAEEAAAAFLETAEKLYNLPLEQAADKIALFNDSISLLDKQIANAIGSEAKNSLLKKKDKNEKKIFKTQKKALKESRKNLKATAKNLKQDDTLSGNGLNKKQKKKIKKAVKNRKEIDLSMFKEGSKGYYAAVKYNAALKTKTKAKYERDMAKQDFDAWKVESAKLKFDNISDDYEKRLQGIGHTITEKNNEMELLTAAGKKVTASLYQSQKKNYAAELAQYQDQYNALNKSLAAIKPNTDEWYAAKDKIQQVASSITDCQKEIYSMNDAILKLRFDRFDDLSASIGRIGTEQEFIQGLFSHEKMTDSKTGQFTEAGKAKLASISVGYQTSKHESGRQEALLKELQQVKANGAQSDGSYKFGDWEFNSLDNLEEKISETYTKWQSSLKETYSAESAMADMMKDKYKAELDSVKELIDAKKKALNSEKDLRSYQRSLQEKTTNISNIQKQITAYSGDTSEEGRARLQKLQAELDRSKQDLKDMEEDRALSDQQDLLDRLYQEYEEAITQKIDDFNGAVTEALNLSNENTAEIADYINQILEKNGYVMEFGEVLSGKLNDSVDHMIKKITEEQEKKEKIQEKQSNSSSSPSTNPTPDLSAYQRPAYSVDSPSVTPASQIKPNKASQRDTAKSFIKKHAKSTKKKPEELSAVNKAIYHNKSGSYSGSKKILSDKDLAGLAKNLGVTYDGDGKRKKLYQKLKSIKLPGFKKGGVISVEDIEKQVKRNGDDGIASVKNGEGILTAAQMELLLKLTNRLPELAAALTNSSRILMAPTSARQIPSISEERYGDRTIHIHTLSLPNVTNYEEFKTKLFRDMQYSQKFEGMMHNMTTNKLSGNRNLEKFKSSLS